MGKVSSSKDLLILLLYAKGQSGTQSEPIQGRTRLMKMMFLFEKEVRQRFNLGKAIPAQILPDFTPYDFGPFSPQVFTDLEFLVELKFVAVKLVGEESLPEEAIEYEYWQAAAAMTDQQEAPEQEEEFYLTELGKSFAKEELVGQLTADQWKILDDFKARCTGTPLRALLRYVYTKYPDMTTESKIRDEVLAEYRY